jgi:hypothetical protein
MRRVSAGLFRVLESDRLEHRYNSAPSSEQFDNLTIASPIGGIQSVTVEATLRVDVRSLAQEQFDNLVMASY